MILNISSISTNKDFSVSFLSALIDLLSREYHIPTNVVAVFNYFTNTEEGKEQLANWAEIRHILKMQPYKFGTIADGFIVEEDEHYTMFMLKYSHLLAKT